MIKHRPADKADEAPGVAEKLEMLVKQATSEKPNRKWYSVSAEGLLDASKWTKNFAGNLVGTVGQLGKMLRPDFSLPKGESRGGGAATAEDGRWLLPKFRPTAEPTA